MMGIRKLLTALATIATVFSLASVGNAVPSEAALQSCQMQLERELPGTFAEFIPGLELPGEIVVIQWQTAMGGQGFCRVTQTGEVLEFTNPYAVPQGQRPIESLLAFETDRYEVRVFWLLERLHMNVYNKSTRRVELNRVLAAEVEAETGTTYTNVLGRLKYEVVRLPEGEYRLVIQSGDRILYDEAGVELEAIPQVTLD